jgi:hypothetical protein
LFLRIFLPSKFAHVIAERLRQRYYPTQDFSNPSNLQQVTA